MVRKSSLIFLLCFGLVGPAPIFFSKLLRALKALLKLSIIDIDEERRTLEVILMSRVQDLDFVINLGGGNSFETSHQIEFLGLKIDNLMPSLRP